MSRVDLPGLRAKTAKGREYWYFEGGERRVRLPEPTAPSFALAYASARRGDAAPSAAPRTFHRLVASYRQSERWTRLAPRTKKDYARVLDWAGDKIGSRHPEAMQRHHVIRAMQANAQRERFANSIKEVLSVLFEHAIDLGWMTHNPAKGIRRLRTERPPAHRPWPQDRIDAFCAAARSTERTICELAIGTGQRIGDVLKMRWDQISEGGILVRQSKRGALLWIPLTARLREWLASVPRVALTIVAGRAGRPLTYDAAAKRVRRVRRDSGCLPWTIHGWRYTAAAEIAGAGASDEEIQAITGHKSKAMVALYSGPARQRARAATAQDKRAKGV